MFLLLRHLLRPSINPYGYVANDRHLYSVYISLGRPEYNGSEFNGGGEYPNFTRRDQVTGVFPSFIEETRSI